MNKKFGYLEGMRFLSKYLIKYRKVFLLFFLGGTIETVITVLTPIIFSVMIDQIVYYRDIAVFLRISMVFIIMTIFTCLLYFIIYTFHHYLMSMYTFDIKMDIFRKFLDSKAKNLVNAKSGEVINHLIYDSAECLHFVIRNVIHMINGLAKGIFYLVYIYAIDFWAGIIVTFFLPIAAVIIFRQKEKLRETVETERSDYGTYVSWLFEILKGLGDIQLLQAEGTVRKDFTGHQRKLFEIRYKAKMANMVADNKIGLVNLSLLLTVFGICAYLSFTGQITIGNVMVLITFITTLNETTIYYAVRSFLDAQARLVRIDRVRRFLANDDETMWKGNQELVIKSGKIEFKNLSFVYDGGGRIFDGLNLTIDAGTHFALVGKSGCGKSTLANLLIGLYEIQSGDILIDGESIYNYSLRSIRRNVGIVQQDILLFETSIRENLLLGNPDSTDEKIWAACERAGIAAFFFSLEMGLDTPLGKGGIQLSGGQKQRLEIARIYLKDPAIIIFDEATSALDKETEAKIHMAWKELLVGRTAIVISHRESSVLLCDKVMLLEDGKARLIGDPGMLIKENEVFRNLFAVDEVES